MASKIDLVSSALVLIGDSPINTLTGNSKAQQTANALYDRIVRRELTKHKHWGFARRKAQLGLTTDVPEDDEWRSIYQLPTDLLVFIKLRPRVNYQIYGDKIYTNLSQELTCDYVRNVAESEWPEYFNYLIMIALAQSFAPAIRDDKTMKAILKEDYKDAMRDARSTDAQQHPQTPIVDSPLIDVRF